MKVQIFLFLLFFNLLLFSQEKFLSASDYSKLQNEVRSLSVTNVDSAIIVADKIEKSRSNIHKAFAKSAKGYLYRLLNDEKKSNIYFKEAFQIIQNEKPSIEKTKVLAYAYNYKGVGEWSSGNLKEALLCYQKAEKLSKDINEIILSTKINTNIALLNAEIENYEEAIFRLKVSDKLIDRNKKLYEFEQYLLNKSNLYLSLGKFYESLYTSEKSGNIILLDSSLYFFKKTLKYSENFDINRVKAKNNIGNILLIKNNFKEAEKIYQNVVIESRAKELDEMYETGIFNLASLYYNIKEYDKSLFHLKKIDSIFFKEKSNLVDYINSNYIQSKIYEIRGDIDLSLKHAEIYLINFEKNQNKNEFEKISISGMLGVTKTLKEMKSIKKKYGYRVFLRKVFFYGLLFVLGIVIVLFLKNKSEKDKIEKKFEEILCRYNNKNIDDNTVTNQKSSTLTIDEEKENEILNKLQQIIDREYYLNQDFTLQYVAKKIKTNTTYLSYVVNKKYGKTFSEYTNELKINYVVKMMIADSKYRKYSTQAIAESVGFKNATSFTRSFSKRTGLSPVQFSQKLENK